MTSTTTGSAVITRFAPSPTGFLHIGGARTALFNWAFARHCGGQYLLRIEDTDRARSTPEAIAAIFDGLDWLGLTPDAPPVYQHANAARHAEIAHHLVAAGHAYCCDCSPDDVEAMRQRARDAGKPPRYDGTCRERALAYQAGKTVVRFKSPLAGQTQIHDIVQGDVAVDNEQLDDLVLLRAEGTPTYMLSVVVDDHDMNITHVIRGDDHLTNALRQTQIYQALDWAVPQFAHIPLIHGADGAKLSKRHGALGAEAYRDMGFLPEAMRNYLARLGWSHGDDELFSTEQLVDWFDLNAIGKAPARFDIEKLSHVNAFHLRASDDEMLLADILARAPEAQIAREKIKLAMPQLKERAQTLPELTLAAKFIFAKRPIAIDEAARKMMTAPRMANLQAFLPALEGANDWSESGIKAITEAFLAENGLKLGELGPALRAVLTGTPNSPNLYDILVILGQEETVGRVQDGLKLGAAN